MTAPPIADRQPGLPRIAHLVDSLATGGAQRLLVTFAEEAARRGVPVTVISLRPDADTPVARRLTDVGARVICLRGRRLRDPRCVVDLVRALQSCRPDLIHAHLSYAIVLASVACRFVGLPWVATLHGLPKPGEVAPAVHALEALALRYGARSVMAVGETVAAVHRARLRDRTVHVVPNAVAVRPRPAPADRRERRRVLAGSPERPIAIAIGRMIPAKGYADLVRALGVVVRSHPDLCAVIAGDGRLRADLEARIVAGGLQRNVSLLGEREDVESLMTAADVYISASHSEGLPVALLEALGAGLPAISTGVGDVPGVLGAAGGVVVPVRQPDRLAEALAALLDDPQRRAEMGDAARAHIREHHDPKAWVDRHLVLYGQAMEQATR
jgi:glycosyltransferase involved in cell wall biosynthesis